MRATNLNFLAVSIAALSSSYVSAETEKLHFRGQPWALQELPEEFKEGSHFTRDYHKAFFAKWYFCSIIFFAAVFFFWRAVFETLKPERYTKKNSTEKSVFVALWTANVHHLIINYFVFQSILYPTCNPSMALAQMRDELCYWTADEIAVRNLMITCGYLTYDFIILLNFYEFKDNFTQQMLKHHFMGASGLFATIYVGYSVAGLGNIALTCEVSTLFLNYRSMYSKEELGKPVPMVNQIIFFLTFTVFRVISYPVIWFYDTYACIMLFSRLSNLQILALFVQWANFTWMLLLNFHWYGLILKGLKKMLQGKKVQTKGSTREAKSEADGPKRD